MESEASQWTVDNGKLTIEVSPTAMILKSIRGADTLIVHCQFAKQPFIVLFTNTIRVSTLTPGLCLSIYASFFTILIGIDEQNQTADILLEGQEISRLQRWWHPPVNLAETTR